MNEKLIQQAYADTVVTVYKVFFGEFTAALADEDEAQKAKDRFRKGIAHARHVRDLALAFCPEQIIAPANAIAAPRSRIFDCCSESQTIVDFC